MFGKLVKIAIWVFSETNWGKVIFDEELRISSFSYFKRKRFGPLAKKKSKALWKLNSTCPEELLMIFFGTVTLLFITFGIWVKNCQLLAEKFQRDCQKWYLSLHWIILRRNYFFWKTYLFFLINLGLRAIFFVLWREYFITVVQNAFHVSIGRVWAKIFFLEKVYFDSFS